MRSMLRTCRPRRLTSPSPSTATATRTSRRVNPRGRPRPVSASRITAPPHAAADAGAAIVVAPAIAVVVVVALQGDVPVGDARPSRERLDRHRGVVARAAPQVNDERVGPALRGELREDDALV